MSQNSLVLPTTGTVSGLQMTQAANNALDTLNTLASGASAPASPEAGQLWHDTTNNLLKLRSMDNTTWISLLQLNESAYVGAPSNSPSGTNDRLNRLVNGAMMIDQANEGSSYSIPTSNTWTYATDQWEVICNSATASGITAQRVTDAPAGFTNSLKVTVGTGASSVGSTDVLQICQPIEGVNLADMGFGTSSALPFSLSFWVKSSFIGTFSLGFGNAGGARTYITTFQVNPTGTWQKITIPNIPGDQSGTWPTNNTQSLSVCIVPSAGTGTQTSTLNAWQSGAFLAANSQTNNILVTSGSTFQITGVQLNSGVFCQPFDRRMFQQELQDCQRYFEKSYDSGTAVAASTFNGSSYFTAAASTSGIVIPMRVTKRADPTVTLYSPSTGTTGKAYDSTASADITMATANIGQNAFTISDSTTSGHQIEEHWAASSRM